MNLIKSHNSGWKRRSLWLLLSKIGGWKLFVNSLYLSDGCNNMPIELSKYHRLVEVWLQLWTAQVAELTYIGALSVSWLSPVTLSTCKSARRCEIIATWFIFCSSLTLVTLSSLDRFLNGSSNVTYFHFLLSILDDSSDFDVDDMNLFYSFHGSSLQLQIRPYTYTDAVSVEDVLRQIMNLNLVNIEITVFLLIFKYLLMCYIVGYTLSIE